MLIRSPCRPSSLLLPLLLLLGGCFTTNKDPHRYFTVDASPLDWLEIVYNPGDDDPTWEHPCRISIFATGMIMLRTGRSPLVMDEFSTETENVYWQDFYQDRISLDKDEMDALLQAFVDRGLFIKEFRKPPPVQARPPIVKFNGIISGDKIWRIASEPELVRLVQVILHLFEERHER